jgi:SAM-dependent methyltransferase
MKRSDIDKGNEFDFGKTSADYARFRDIYPASMYEKLVMFGIGLEGQRVLDLGSGTAILPLNMAAYGAHYTATDLSENQIALGRQLAAERGISGIDFRVCPAEETGFEDDSFDAVTAVQCFPYFDAERAAEEIRRVLKPRGRFCKIIMDWKPLEDEAIAEMEALVKQYNPAWSGCGFDKYRFAYPAWAEGRFEIETVHSYDADLCFSREAWIGRIKSCRGIGASLPREQVDAFEREYRDLLQGRDEPLNLKHQIHIEIYRSTKG